MASSNSKHYAATDDPRVQLVSIPGLFVEINHIRGNVTFIERMTTESITEGAPVWEPVDVWDLRRFTDEQWKMMPSLALSQFSVKEIAVFRITRYPELEDEAETTYHPTIPSWKIDINKVEEFLYHG